jgi:hypothetical protein
MEFLHELSRRELLALKEIRLTGQTNDQTIALKMSNDGMIVHAPDGCLELTADGRRMLVRGSPALWESGSLLGYPQSQQVTASL